MLDKLKRLLTSPKAMRPMHLNTSEYESVSLSVADIKSALYAANISELLQLYATLIQRDLTLSAALNQRKQQLANVPFTVVDAGNDKAWAAILPHLNIPLLISRLAVAIEYGVSLTDVTWGQVVADDGNSYFLPTGYHTIAPLNIGHDTQINTGINDALYLTDSSGNKQPLSGYSPAKLLIHYHAADDTHINRYSPVYKAAWLVALKHHALSRNMQYFDALGVPPLIIIKVDAFDDDELKAVMEQGRYLRSAATGVFSKDTDIDVLKGNATKAEFLDFIRYVDEQIQLAINGNTLSSAHADSGSRAQSEVHERRLYEKRDFDARLLEGSINQLLTTVAALNFATSKVRFSFNLDPAQDLLSLSEIHRNLADAGFQIPDEFIAQTYGIEGVRAKVADTGHQSNDRETLPAMSLHSNASDRDDADADLPALNAVQSTIKQSVNELLTGVDSYEQLLDKLAAHYVDMDLSDLDEQLSEHLLNHKILANAEVNAENPHELNE